MSQATKYLTEVENWEILSSFLPPDWAEQARRLGAMRRARYISDPGIVLRILLLHLATGCSLAETAARASASGLAPISAVGVFKRLRAAEPWLRWLAQQMRGAADLPLEAAGRRLRAVDATSVSEPGSTGTDWKVHWAVNLADLQCDFFELTDIREGGETFRRVPVVMGDILMGDRVYAAPPGVAHVVKAQGDVLVRLNRQALPLFERDGRRIDLLDFVGGLQGKRPREREARVRSPQGGWIAGRLIALRQSAEVTRSIQRRLRRRAQRSQETVSVESLQFAEYFMLWTTLTHAFSTATVLELYRLRWQIELVFKRMKSILGLGHLPKKDPLSAQAWLEGKLFTGLLIERMVHTAQSFSPWGYALAATAQPMARD
jgi:Transposase DDE domain